MAKHCPLKIDPANPYGHLNPSARALAALYAHRAGQAGGRITSYQLKRELPDSAPGDSPAALLALSRAGVLVKSPTGSWYEAPAEIAPALVALIETGAQPIKRKIKLGPAAKVLRWHLERPTGAWSPEWALARTLPNPEYYPRALAHLATYIPLERATRDTSTGYLLCIRVAAR